MNAVSLWLLISVGFMGPNKAAPSQVVERFVTKEECMAVRDVLNGRFTGGWYSSDFHQCINVRVARP